MPAHAPRVHPKSEDDASGRGRRPTINDVARQAGVSKKTVSRVINDAASVRDETRRRVAEVVAELGFVPDPAARGLALRRAFVIGFIYNNPNAQYVVNAQQGILDAAQAAGFELMVRPCDRESPDFVSEMRRFVERQRFAGVVLFPSVSEDARLAELLRELQTPYVRVASAGLDDPRTLVSQDREGAFAVAAHLAALGHRRIALITGPAPSRSSRERRGGFEAGLDAHGLALDPTFLREGDYTFETGVARARELLTLPQQPTAIAALNDEMAAGVYRVARDLGMSIPGDLSVVGFDDAPIATRLWPPLTSVLLPIREMGRIAAAALIAEARGAEPAPWPIIRPRLVERGSTASPKGG